MFERLLIANRGEIACRVARTARRLGIRTIAVYSEADADALHVDLADEAWPIGPAPARDSYLSIDKLVEVARRSGAQAVHPGYGFLAENPEFAERCEQAGLIFVGPPSQAMRLMGSKAAAKALMERAGVPIVPGYHGDATDVAALTNAAERIGFPLLVKASAGGGGRGMRIVRAAADLVAAVAGAKREALASFGDESVLIEKYLTRHRHVEIQIFADAQGEVVSFYERDCSMQRYHQKILEETPAPGLSTRLRRAMSEAAIQAARAVGYVGVGTVEFLLRDEAFFFLEMNTRLQVEHPVTEMIAGQDLVEWQLRVACGEKLPLTQDELVMRGCAMEVRVCAENPARDFLPSVGEIRHLHAPRESPTVRVDTGVRRGDRITQYYDSLIAKLVVWGADRAATLRTLQSALDEFELVGVATNLDMLRGLAKHSLFASGEYDTEFVERHADALTMLAAPAESDETVILAAGVAAWLAEVRQRERERARDSGDRWSPWGIADGWRANASFYHDICFEMDGRKLTARVYPLSDGAFRLETPSISVVITAKQAGDRLSLRIDGVKRELGVVSRADGLVVVLAGRNYFLKFVEGLTASSREVVRDRRLSAPLPAKVTRVLAGAGDRVRKGAPLVILEAMKMEITLTAPRDGVIESVRCAEGEMTAEGVELIALAEDKPT